MAYVAIADRDAPIHDPHTFIEKYIWSQDHKVIAIQYAIVAIFVGLVALVLSGLMRLQLGFPDTFHFVAPNQYYQFITMHGMIMVIYLLTALFLGGFGNYLIPLMCGSRDMVFPYMNMVSFWVYLVAVIVLLAELLRARRADRRRLDALSAAGDLDRHAGGGARHHPDARLARHLHRRLHDGRAELRDDGPPGALQGHDADAHAALGLGHLHGDDPRPARVPRAVRLRDHDDARRHAGHQLLHAGDQLDGREPGPRRRQPAAVPAPVLVLRAPGGVHRRPARLRHRLGPALDARAQEHLRLPDDGLGDPRDRRPVLRRVGAPHVRVRHEPVLRVLLRDHDADHRDTDRDQGLQLGADALEGRHPPDRADAVRDRLHLHVRARRAHGPVPRQRDRRPAAVRLLLRGRALPHGDGRFADPGRVRRDLPLVPEDHRPHVERAARQDPLLADLPRDLRDLSSDALPGHPRRAAPLLRARRHRVPAAVRAHDQRGDHDRGARRRRLGGHLPVQHDREPVARARRRRRIPGRRPRSSGRRPTRRRTTATGDPGCRWCTAGPTTTACPARRTTSSRRPSRSTSAIRPAPAITAEAAHA